MVTWSTVATDAMRVLTFRVPSAAIATDWRRYLAFGLVCTWLAGVGRYWDSPRAELWQHLGLGSVAYVFVLATIIWVLLMPLRPARWSCNSPGSRSWPRPQSWSPTPSSPGAPATGGFEGSGGAQLAAPSNGPKLTSIAKPQPRRWGQSSHRSRDHLAVPSQDQASLFVRLNHIADQVRPCLDLCRSQPIQPLQPLAHGFECVRGEAQVGAD